MSISEIVSFKNQADGFVNRVYHKSSESMGELPDNTVSLTVTSPPYWNAIDYDRHSRDSNDYYRTRNYSIGYSEYHDYLTWLRRISSEVLRVTKPGGFYALVVGTVLLQKRHYPVPFDVTAGLTQDGWDFHQDFIWHKVTGGVKRAGVFLQKPYPGYFYPNIMTEYILVFRKPGQEIYKERCNAERQSAKVDTQRLFTNEIANTVWHIAPVPPGHLDHPCPFPEEIPYRLIRLYSYPGEVILDPFCGSGQTLKVARYLSRDYVGYDISEKYVILSKNRIHELPALRQEQLVAVFEKIPMDAQRTGGSRVSKRTRYGKKQGLFQTGEEQHGGPTDLVGGDRGDG
ncbi:MAG: site-specific DNA-methyltransferase [Bacillota bacterium]